MGCSIFHSHPMPIKNIRTKLIFLIIIAIFCLFIIYFEYSYIYLLLYLFSTYFTFQYYVNHYNFIEHYSERFHIVKILFRKMQKRPCISAQSPPHKQTNQIQLLGSCHHLYITLIVWSGQIEVM